jgi:hypothetical protein
MKPLWGDVMTERDSIASVVDPKVLGPTVEGDDESSTQAVYTALTFSPSSLPYMGIG